MGWRKWQGERRQPLGPERSEKGTRNPRPFLIPSTVSSHLSGVRRESVSAIRFMRRRIQRWWFPTSKMEVFVWNHQSLRGRAAPEALTKRRNVYGKQDRLAPTVTRVAVQAPLANMPLTLTGSPTFKSANVMRVATVVALVFNR